MKKFVIFGVFTVAFLYGEMFALIKLKEKGTIMAINFGNGTKMLIGDVENGIVMTSEVAGDDARPLLIKKYLEK